MPEATNKLSQGVEPAARAPRTASAATVRRSSRAASASAGATAVRPATSSPAASQPTGSGQLLSASASISATLPPPPRVVRPPRPTRVPAPSVPASGLSGAGAPQQATLDLSGPAAVVPAPRRKPAPSTRISPTRPSQAQPVAGVVEIDPGASGGAIAIREPRARRALPSAQTATATDPDVWLVALATAGGGLRHLEGADRSGAIRVSRPYGHLRTLRPVMPPEALAAGTTGFTGPLATTGELPDLPVAAGRRSRGLGSGLLGTGPGASGSTRLPAERPKPAIVSSVEIETDAGVFRVERPDSVLDHSDLAWALANLEAGEPESLIPLPRRQLALLLTLLPTPEDPEHPEQDSVWGWAHRLKAPWERGALHPRGKLGRLIAVDPDPSNKGMHRACFEMLGSEEVVWALGVPCYRTGSVYELVPLRRSRWLSWPLAKTRSRSAAAATEQPEWEIARVVFRVGAPRWPLAGVVEPLGPLGVAG